MPRETARDHLCSRYAAVIAARARTTSRLTPRPSYKSILVDYAGDAMRSTSAAQFLSFEALMEFDQARRRTKAAAEMSTARQCLGGRLPPMPQARSNSRRRKPQC